MANAKRDGNGVPTLIGARNTDGVTITPVEATPSTHGLEIDDGITGTDHGTVNAKRDGNHIPIAMAVSEDDGVTPVTLYVTSGGALLIDST